MYKVEILSKANRHLWSDFVNNHPMSNIYHKIEFIDAAENIKGLESHHIIVKSKNKIKAIVPIFFESFLLSSIRFTNNTFPSGPLIKGNDALCLKFILEYLNKFYSERYIYQASIRVTNLNFVKFSKLLNFHGYQESLRGCHVIIDLRKGYDSVSKKYSPSKRRYIKKSLRSDFSFQEIDSSKESILKFYSLYKKLIFIRHKSNFFNHGFFESLKINLGSSAQFLYLKKGDSYCGVFVNLVDKKNNTLINLIGVVDDNAIKNRGFEYMHDCSIRIGCKLNLEKYDMGGSGSLITEGVLKFKSEFGGLIIPYLSWQRNNNAISRLFFSFIKKYKDNFLSNFKL